MNQLATPERTQTQTVQPCPDTKIDQLITDAIDSGVQLTENDRHEIRSSLEKAEECRRQAQRAAGCQDPLNKGNAFPMGVGFTRMTRRLSNRIDASVRRAGEAVKHWERAAVHQQHAEKLLRGKGTEGDKTNKAEKHAKFQRELARLMLTGKKGQKISSFTVTRINKDRDGYPISFNFEGDGVIKGIGDKIDVVKLYFGGSTLGYRQMIDQIRADIAAAPITQ